MFGVILTFLLLLLVSWVVYFVTKKIVIPVLIKRINKNRYQWDSILMRHKVLHKLIFLIPILIFYNGAGFLGSLESIVRTIMVMLLLLQFANVAGAFLDSVNDIYSTLEVSKEKPIKGFLQVIKIIVYVLALLLIVAGFVDTNPFVLLSGLGAVAAVFSFIFKDTILGLVAGVLLSVNNMLRIGDWIEMPQYGANGDVIDITMNAVKVQNFDMTITTVPAYALISDSFKNWRGIQETGSRRIMRAILIDVSSICFCSDETWGRYEKIIHEMEGSDPKEKKRADTNMGAFQRYLKGYLANHPNIKQSQLQIIRQLAPTEKGIPLEIYAFADTVDWVIYEGIQSEIMEHVIGMAPRFDLELYQLPSGKDLNRMITNQ